MKLVVKPRKIKVIQREIVRYICDYCGKGFSRGNGKRSWYDTSTGKTKHFHKGCERNAIDGFHREEKKQGGSR